MSKENNIPKHWQVKKLGEVCEIIMGQSPPSTTYNSQGIGLPFFQGKAEFTELHPIVKKWCSTPNKIALSNDILLSVRAPVGTTNIANQKCCIGRGLAAIRYENYKYIFYLLRSLEQQLDKKGTGTTFRAISGETIRRIEIPLPSLPEQQAIVSKIEELLSDLENGKQQLLTAQQQLKVYRQSLLKAAFEGKLTSSIKELRNEGSKELRNEGSKELRNERIKELNHGNHTNHKNHSVDNLPEGWKYEKLGDVIKTIDGDRGPNYPKKNEFFEDGFCLFLSTKNVRIDRFLFEEKIFITKEKDEKLRSGRLQLNDVVITTRGTLGNVALYDEKIPYKQIRINSGMLILRITKEYLSNYFLMKFVTSPNFISQLKEKQSGTAQPQIPANVLREIIIPIPPIKEQQLIVDELESKLTVCDKIEETISQSLQQAETLRQSILKKAFEGKLTSSIRE